MGLKSLILNNKMDISMYWENFFSINKNYFNNIIFSFLLNILLKFNFFIKKNISFFFLNYNLIVIKKWYIIYFYIYKSKKINKKKKVLINKNNYNNYLF